MCLWGRESGRRVEYVLYVHNKTQSDDFFTGGEVLLWLWTRILAGSNELMLKCLDDLFLTNTQFFSSQYINWWLEWCGILVDYCDVFISCLVSHSDGTHSLQRIHWWVTDAMLHFSKPAEETISSTSYKAWESVHFQHI